MLEAGFENTGLAWLGNFDRMYEDAAIAIYDDGHNPFFKLGQRLRDRQRPA